MDAILVTFQEHVVMRGAAIRRLREAQGSIADCEHYLLLTLNSRKRGRPSPWDFFFAAVHRAAAAQDRFDVIKQLDEAEKVLLSIAQMRHQIMTGAKVSDHDLRGAYFQAVEAYIQNETRAANRASRDKSPPEPLLRLQRSLAYDEPVIDQKTIKGAGEPAKQAWPKVDLPSFLVPKPKLRESRTTDLASVWDLLRPALADRRIRQGLGAGCLVLFAIIVYFGAALLPEHWRFNAGTITNALEPAIAQASLRPPPQAAPKIPPKPPAPMARIVSPVNVHANPVSGGDIVSTLPRGTRVSMIEKRGSWTLVRAEKVKGREEPVVGWVYISFLSAEGARTEQPPETDRN